MRTLKINKYIQDLKDPAIYVDLNGTVLISGGINTVLMRPELKCLMVDSINERTIDMGSMLEPKFKH